jgi:hypothetical protein
LYQFQRSPSPDLYELARLYARLDRNGDALALLERALSEHVGSMVFLLEDDAWDTLRHERRFEALVKKMGLGPQ